MKNSIEIGDIVNVVFETSDSLPGVKVLRIPCATDDFWIFESIADSYPKGQVHYVQRYQFITKIEDKGAAQSRLTTCCS